MESVQNEIKNQNYELQQMNEQNKSKLLATQTKLKDLEQENQYIFIFFLHLRLSSSRKFFQRKPAP